MVLHVTESSTVFSRFNAPLNRLETIRHPSSSEFRQSSKLVQMSSQINVSQSPCRTSTDSEGSTLSSFSSPCRSNSNCSSVSQCGTPRKDFIDEAGSLSESPTPTGTDLSTLDPDQVTLRIYLYAARCGNTTVPAWDGLADALRVYFSQSWQKDTYTLQYCQQQKEFLFWNAVGEEKWRS